MKQFLIKIFIGLFFLSFCVGNDLSSNSSLNKETLVFSKKREIYGRKNQNLRVVSFGAICRYLKTEIVPFGPCSSKYLRCLGENYRIESCKHGEVVLDEICQPAINSEHCFSPKSNSLNAVTIKLANAIGACDGSPGIIVDPENRCSRQALVCDPSIEPTAFNCPKGYALDFRTLTCFEAEECQHEHSTTEIKDSLISAYCKYPPLEESFDRRGQTSTFCQDWFVDCNVRQFVFCEPEKLFDKKKQFCRSPLPEDRCSLQNCLNWEWMRVPLGQCIPEFAFCEGRIPELFRCSQGRIFKDGVCLLQSQVQNCAVCEPGERKPAKHCREYFECRLYQNHDHPWIKMTCPNGEFYNRQWKTCEEDNGGACADYRKCQDGESFSPTCGDYLLCQNGKFIFGRCPHLTRWSQEDRSCIPDNQCRRYETNDNICRPGDVIKTSDCENYFVCDTISGEYVKRSCKDSLYEASGPCDYCRHSQPYKSKGDVSNVNCEENSKFVDANDCSRYFECINSRYIERICEEGSSFDPDSGRCSYEFQKRCRKQLRINGYYVPAHQSFQGFPPAPPPNWNPSEERRKAFENAGEQICRHGSPAIPDPRDCAVYLQCVGGFYRPIICPPGTNFDENSRRCLNGDSHCFGSAPKQICQDGDRLALAECGKVLQCSDGLWKRKRCKNQMAFINDRCSTTISCRQSEYVPQLPKQDSSYAYQDDGDCTRYYIIVNGQVVQRQCSNGQKFDESTGRCSYSYKCKSNAPNCYENEVKPIEGSCEKYWKCISGQFIEVVCPYGHHFHKYSKICKPGNCGGFGPDHISDQCTESSGLAGFRSNHHDCHKFYQCANGKWVPKDCGLGTAFAPELGVCNYIQNVPSCARNNLKTSIY